MTFGEEEIIQSIKDGLLCRAFGCIMERVNYYQDANDKSMNFKCKYCKREIWA